MASGRPDWFGTIVSAGKYDTQMIPMAVDENGALLALMKGAYDAVLKTIAVDTNGIMKANLSVQDLDFLTVRPAYGDTIRSLGTTTISPGNTTSVFSVTGRGILLPSRVDWGGTVSRKKGQVHLFFEDVLVAASDAESLNDTSRYAPYQHPLFLHHYDDVGFTYYVSIAPGLTFETKFEVKCKNAEAAGDIDFDHEIMYALVP